MVHANEWLSLMAMNNYLEIIMNIRAGSKRKVYKTTCSTFFTVIKFIICKKIILTLAILKLQPQYRSHNRSQMPDQRNNTK